MDRRRGSALRVGIDATPLIGARTGVGNYAFQLLGALADLLPDAAPPTTIAPTYFSIRGQAELPPAARESARVRPARRPRLPARLLQQAWAHGPLPPVEWLSGDVDVFHATNFVLPPTRRAAGVVSVHDLTFLHHADTVTHQVLRYRELVPASVARAARVICFADCIADEIADAMPIGRDRIEVIPHGVEPAWFTATAPDSALRAQLGLPPQYLLFVGSLEPRKNLGLLVRAHRLAREADPAAVPPLVLVGPAGWGDRWDGEPPNPADVIQTGYLSTDVLRHVVAGARALCLPSRYEGFGLPVLEALAAGTPVLASDIGAHREVAGDAATLLPLDTEAWVTALRGLPEDTPVAALARQHHAGRFSWTRSAQRHLNVYASAAD